MWSRAGSWGAGVCLVFGVGCSLALDTDRFRGAVAADAGALDGGAADGGARDGGGVEALAARAVRPEVVLEGLGSGHPTVRPEPVLVLGAGLDGVETVTADRGVQVRGFTASADGRALGVAVVVPVDSMLAAGVRRTVTLTLGRGAETVTATFAVAGLDELILRPGEAAPAGFDPPVYSEIRVEGGRLGGRQVGRLVATARLAVLGPLRIDGLSNGDPGPGGCAGGRGGRAGTCGEARSGQPGQAAAEQQPSGGGGAGNRTAGEAGGAGDDGLTPGSGGEADPREAPVDGLRAAAGRGGGGGGTSDSGAGGGGGGALAFVSRGVVELSAVDARGGPGEVLPGPDCDRAGGGGGSGGAVLVRGWRVEGAAVDVSGGAAGGAVGCANRGGAAGAGLVHVQASLLDPPVDATPQDSLRSGPAWPADTPWRLAVDDTTLRLTGVAGRTYAVTVNDGPARPVLVPAGGVAQFTVTIDAAGPVQVCLLAAAPPAVGVEGRDCLGFVAF